MIDDNIIQPTFFPYPLGQTVGDNPRSPVAHLHPERAQGSGVRHPHKPHGRGGRQRQRRRLLHHLGHRAAGAQADPVRQHGLHERAVLPLRRPDPDGGRRQEAGVLGGAGRQPGAGTGGFAVGDGELAGHFARRVVVRDRGE